MTYYSPSQLAKYMQCGMLWHYHYGLGLRPVVESSSEPQKAGRLMHKLLATYYASSCELEAALTELPQVYAAQGFSRIGNYDYMTEGHFEVILKNYADEYPGDKKARVVLQIEEPLHNDAFRLQGIPDLVMETNEGLEVWDHKCTTGWLSRLENRMRYSIQIPLYAILLSEELGEPVRRSRINALLIKDNASNAKSKAEKFARFSPDPDRPVLTEFQIGDTLDWFAAIKAEIEARVESGAFYRTPGEHCNWCDFKGVCHARTERRREAALSTDFISVEEGA